MVPKGGVPKPYKNNSIALGEANIPRIAFQWLAKATASP